jgi:sensor histidine kinase regulating citrate/malate metabolism
MAQDSGLRNRFLRNTLILAIAIVIALISFNIFYITPSFTKLFVSGTRNDAMRIARHLASTLLVSERIAIGKDSLNAEVSKEVDKLKEDFDLMNLKIFSASGEVVFSGNPDEIGEINQRSYFRDIVAKGKVYAEVVPKDKESLEGRKVSSDVLETYLPLTNNRKFLGAVEIYYEIADTKKQLDRLISQSSAITFMFAAGLLISVILLLVQENRSMKKRTQLEAERLQRERLEGVIEMAGAACHEFNQPLQALLGYSELLSEDLPEGSPLLDGIQKIRRSIDQLAKITRKIMHITKYETKEYIEGSKIIDIDKASS